MKKSNQELNISKVIQILRKSGKVALVSDDDIHIVTNTHFLLVLSDDELWEIQSSLKLRKVGFIYLRGGRTFCEYAVFPKEKALSIIRAAMNTKNVLCQNTGLFGTDQSGSTIAYLIRGGTYVQVDSNYIGIFHQISSIHQAAENYKGPLLINGKHLISPVCSDVSKYLVTPIAVSKEAG